MNRYKKSVQVIDSRKYKPRDVRSYNSFNYELMKIVSSELSDIIFFNYMIIISV